MYASENGHIDCVKLLIQHGANVNYNNGLLLSSLYRALNHNHKECVEELLEHGANVEQSVGVWCCY